MSNYATALNKAIDLANDTGRTIQLRKVNVYGRAEFDIRFAVTAAKRFGVDLEGEFVEPNTPKAEPK